MNRVVVVPILSIAIAGCSTLPIVESLEELGGCKKLGAVEGTGEFERDAAIDLVEKTKKLGGNTVYLPAERVVEVTIAHGPGAGSGREAWQETSLVGTAYVCP